MAYDGKNRMDDREKPNWSCFGCETTNTGERGVCCGEPEPEEQEKKRCSCGYYNRANAKFCSKCGRRLKRLEIHWKKAVGAAFVFLAIVCVIKVLVPALSETQNQFIGTPTEHTAAVQEAVSENAWKNNILMKDRAMEVIPLGGYRSSVMMNTVLGSDLMRAEISRVVFEDSVENAPEDCWDASEAQDNSVLAWAIPTGADMYELHIAAEGGVNGKMACEDLFCGYGNVTSIEFNDCFHTEEAEDLSRMFYGCWQMENLDVRGIRTDSAINLSEMFANCHYLTSVDVSGFDTSNVEDTSGMFSNCWDLQIVDITGFDLFHVRDVSYMFYACPAGERLQVIRDGFWFRNVDRYEHFMDEEVLVEGKPWITLFETEDTPPKQEIPDVAVGDLVMLGRYEQDNILSNGPEPVEWLVLNVQEDKLLLLSRYALDSHPYHNATATVSWETSSLREWLNSEFLSNAFTATERDFILLTEVDNGKSQGNRNWKTDGGNNTYDSIFLLSYAEIDRYFANQESCVCGPTPYAMNMGADVREVGREKANVGWWWLRSPGEKNNQAAFVNFDGARYSNMVSNGYLSVRPALWFDLSKAELEN